MVVNILGAFPIVYSFSAAWTYSNQQVFMNRVVPKQDDSLFPMCDHHFLQWFHQLTPGTIFFGALCIVIVVRVIRIIVNLVRGKVLHYQGTIDEIRDMVPDQELEPYFSHLKNKTKEGWIREEGLC